MTKKYGIRYNLDQSTDWLDEYSSKRKPVPQRVKKQKVSSIPAVTNVPEPPATHKTCPGCKLSTPVQDYLSKTGRKYARCKQCRKKKNDTDYATREKHRLDRKAIKSELLISFGGCCSRCGYNEFQSALEFHHKNKWQKDRQVSTLVNHYVISPSEDNWDKLLAECGRCVVLCSNCHQALHAGDW